MQLSVLNIPLTSEELTVRVGMGGEQVSLAIQSSSATSFSAAGYANISTNATYVGGVVRQYGNLSFSRVFDAGHQGISLSSPPQRCSR
jgi:hypothetical protein